MITHIVVIWELIPGYTGHLLHRAFWQELICVIRGLHRVLSVEVSITHIYCLGINFPIARTFVTQKNCFRIICVIISGLIVHALRINLQKMRKAILSEQIWTKEERERNYE